MQEERNLDYAGNLLEEMREINKTVSDSDAMGTGSTSTVYCAKFLTIYCC